MAVITISRELGSKVLRSVHQVAKNLGYESRGQDARPTASSANMD